MSDIKISKRYAKALYDFSAEEKMIEQSFNDMSLIYKISAESKELKNFLKSPIIKNSKKVLVLKEIFGKSVSEISIKFIEIISSSHREDYLNSIAEQYISIYKEHAGIKVASIKTALALDENIRKQIISELEKQTGATIELNESVKEELIGGFVLSLDKKELDTSLKSKLISLRKEFESNLFVKKY